MYALVWTAYFTHAAEKFKKRHPELKKKYVLARIHKLLLAINLLCLIMRYIIFRKQFRYLNMNIEGRL